MHLPPPLPSPQHTAGAKSYLCSPASSYLVTQDWCNSMQSGSLAHFHPPSSDLLFLLSTHSSLAFSVADHHSRSLSLFVSLHLLDCPKFTLFISCLLSFSQQTWYSVRMAEDAVFRWTFAAEPDKAHTVLEGDAGYLQWVILLMVAFN